MWDEQKKKNKNLDLQSIIPGGNNPFSAYDVTERY